VSTIKKQFVMLSEQKWTKSKMIFLKSGTLIFVLFGIIIKDGCFHSAFALPSLCLRSYGELLAKAMLFYSDVKLELKK
jgi:hypothetical protein